MIEDRNKTAHIYNENAAEAIYQELPDHLRLLRALQAALRQDGE